MRLGGSSQQSGGGGRYGGQPPTRPVPLPTETSFGSARPSGSERGALSPGICSDGSTSSVNVRQRKLSDCIVDWVFDDSDSCMMSDISEAPPPLLIDDGELFLHNE